LFLNVLLVSAFGFSLPGNKFDVDVPSFCNSHRPFTIFFRTLTRSIISQETSSCLAKEDQVAVADHHVQLLHHKDLLLNRPDMLPRLHTPQQRHKAALQLHLLRNSNKSQVSLVKWQALLRESFTAHMLISYESKLTSL
jgi:hypothetical protein